MTALAQSYPASTARTRGGARIAIAGAAVSGVSLAALHVLRPDLAPSWHVISEYAVGPNGWMMALCFGSLAIGCAGLLSALLTEVRTIGGRVGLGALALAVIGLAMAAFFPIDPITTPPGEPTLSGTLHGVASMIGNPGLIVAALCLAFALRNTPRWAGTRNAMLTFAHLSWIGFALMAVAMVSLMSSGSTDGLGWVVGYANRLLMIAYIGWVITSAWPLARR